MARIVANSKKKYKIVGKLVYQSREPYIILYRSSLGTYNCRNYGKPTSTIKKFKTKDLYLLPLSLFLQNRPTRLISSFLTVILSRCTVLL